MILSLSHTHFLSVSQTSVYSLSLSLSLSSFSVSLLLSFPLFSSKAGHDDFTPGVGTVAAVAMMATMSTRADFWSLSLSCFLFVLLSVLLSLSLCLFVSSLNRKSQPIRLGPALRG